MDKELLYHFFNGQTTLEEELRIRMWMEASPEHKKRFFEERKMFDTMNLLINEEDLRRRKIGFFHQPWIKELGKIAAVIALTLAISISSQHIFSDKELLAMQKIEVPIGQRVNIELPDGTIVWLNSRSQISYPTTFSKDERKIKLDGEAYFEVIHTSDNKPFIVETAYGSVEVLGTKFNLEAYSESASFVTSLLEGSVRVKSQDQQLVLRPDQMAYLEDGKLKAETITDYNPYKWREGLIYLKNESFPDIMKEFEKAYGVEIQIKTPKVQNYSCSGKFRQSDGIFYALKVLQKGVDFTFEQNEDNHIIYIK